MVKSGLIAGAAAFLLVLATGSILSPLCAPCLGIFIGLLAGYLAGVFDKPLDGGAGAKSGAIAGGIAGVLGMLGNFGAAVINGLLVNPATLANFYRALNITPPAADQTTIWIGQLGGACCIGLVNLAVMAGLGAAGGALWVQFNKKNQAEMNAPLPPAV